MKDFDLMYPEGFGEAVSGGEREHRYEKVVERMRGSGENVSNYEWYLEMLRNGIPISAGFGIGVKRLTRFICGLKISGMRCRFLELLVFIVPKNVILLI